MFTGIEDVDWASMHHAYGDASDVPDLLRGLASDDPAERDLALDGMYGAVHHQGDVYDCTVACVPFLFELLTEPAVRDRGAVLALLGSIAGEREPDPEEIWTDFEDEAEHEAWVANYVTASALIRGRSADLLPLLDDPDPQLRAQVPGALVRLHPDGGQVLTALRRRLPAEPDPGVARAVLAAVGDLGARHPEELGEEAGGCLLRVVHEARPRPALLLTALTALARCAPRLLPPDTAESAREAMRIARHAPADAPAESRPRTETLVSYLRELEADHRAEADADEAVELLERLHFALGDRTQERLALVTDQLASPHRGQRIAAIDQAALLLSGWRLPSEEPVRLLARHALDEDDRVARDALGALAHLHPLARGVADTLAEALPAFRREAGAENWWWTTRYGRALEALALQGDPRAVPELAWALESGASLSYDLQRSMEALRPHYSQGLLLALAERLRDLHPEAHRSRARILDALSVPAPVGALRVMAHFLDSEDVATRMTALRGLARYGADAAEHAERVRQFVAAESEPYRRVHAVGTLWAVTGEGDLDLVLEVLGETLREERANRRADACVVAGRVGRAAEPLAPLLRSAMRDGEDPVGAAIALWEVTGAAEEVVPALLDGWSRAYHRRPATARCLAELGAAAAPAAPLVRAELARSRRHGNDGPVGRTRYHVDQDEELLADCRRVLAA
ncbi:HEAT repeat domain-containing protein [Streptomyces sp. NPDC003635]